MAERQPSFLDEVRSGVNLFHWWAAAHLIPMELLFLRKVGTLGVHHERGMHVCVAVFYLGLFATAFQSPEHVPVMVLWFAFLAAGVVHMLRRKMLEFNGWECHSRFTGMSRFAPEGGDQVVAKGVIEPLACLAAGIVLSFLPDCRGLANYALLSIPAALICVGMNQARDHAIKIAQRDARIESELYAQEDE